MTDQTIRSAHEHGRARPPAFDEVWPAIDAVPGFLVPGQERWLFNAAANLPEDAVIVEIGSFLGRSTTAMAMACRGTRRKIFCIDTFQGNDTDFVNGQSNVTWEGDEYLSTFKANLSRNDLLSYIVPLQGFSHDVGKDWTTQIDFLFVDGSHDYEDVISDFRLFLPWVKPGGLIAFHDVQPEWPGPHGAWRDVIRHRLEAPAHFFSIAYGRRQFDGSAFTGTVHVIIPVHNRVSITQACLRTLRTQTIASQLKVHVVNDGSVDSTRQVLAADFPEVHVIEGDGNLWWTGAVAKALSELQGEFREDDFILLVNNDARLNPETVEILVRESERLNRAAVAPIALCGSQAIATGWAAGTAPILNDFERQFERLIKEPLAIEVKAIYGRCSLIPVEILDVAGNFDAGSFPHYLGDTDFCFRARRKGAKFYVTGSTCIRVIENDRTTGSHHGFRQGPQSWRAVKDNMFSFRSIDNVPATWRFLQRHHPERKYVGTMIVIWRSLRQWAPIYNGFGLEPLDLTSPRRPGARRRYKYYARRILHYLCDPPDVLRKLAQMTRNRRNPQ